MHTFRPCEKGERGSFEVGYFHPGDHGWVTLFKVGGIYPAIEAASVLNGSPPHHVKQNLGFGISL